nr:IS5 family transposase [Vibrio parahaemolyticus]
MPLIALQGFIDSLFKLANIPIVSPYYTCISRRAKDVEISFKTKTRGSIQHLAIDVTGLKVYGEGEWKVKKYGTDGKRRVRRKLHIAVDTSTHEIVAAKLSLSNVTDAEVLPNLLKQARRKIIEISGDGAYDSRRCHDAIRVKLAVWLSQTLAIRDSNVSGETVVRWKVKPKKLQRSSWRDLRNDQSANRLTGLGMPETEYVV